MRAPLTAPMRKALALMAAHSGRVSRSRGWWVDGEGVQSIRHDVVLALQARGLLEVDEESIPWGESGGWKSRKLTPLGWMIARDPDAAV